MKWQNPNPSWVLSCILAAIFLCGPAWSAIDPSRGASATFFSRGQAVFDPQDRVGSQEEAIRDFKAQAVTQAVGTFLDPSQMGSQLGPLQEKVLGQPEQYVESYQIFSESPAGGLYRVTGQATVSVAALREDLLRSGFAIGDGAPPSSATVDPEVDAREEPALVVAQQQHEEARPAKSARESAKSKQKYLWVVPERWAGEWFLPRDRRDPSGLFALSVLQESQDYDWTPVFPLSSSIYVDPRGRVSQDDALSAASDMGSEKVILGSADLVPRGSTDASFAVNLRVLDVASGKSLGEIHRETDLGDASDQQGAMDMAFALVPKLDRLLRALPPARVPAQSERPSSSSQPSQTWQPGPSRESQELEETGEPDESDETETSDRFGESSESGESVESMDSRDSRDSRDSGESEESEASEDSEAAGEPRESGELAHTMQDQDTEPHGGPGEWTLFIRADHQYAYWEDLAKVLLDRFKSMRVRSIEVGGKEARIRLDGIDGESIASIQGTLIRDGMTVQVDVLSSEKHSLRVTFSRSEEQGTERAQ